MSFFADLSQSYLVFIVERSSDVIDVFGYCLCNQARRLCHIACRSKVRIAGFQVQVVCVISTQPVLHTQNLDILGQFLCSTLKNFSEDGDW